MRKLLILFLLSLPVAAQQTIHYAGEEIPNVFSNTNQFQLGLQLGPILFANLGTVPASTTLIFITDGTLGSNPCQGGGTGALALQVNGVWNCAPGGSGGGGGTPGAPSQSVQFNANGVFGGITNVAAGSILASRGSSSVPAFQTKAVVDVRDLGMDCTGVTDSYTLWNTNITAGTSVIMPVGCIIKIGSNLTIPSTVTVMFAQGAMWAPSPSVLIIQQGSTIAGDRQQIVSLTSGGTVQFRGSARVMVDWYGAANDGVTDDCIPVNNALNSGARDLVLVKANGTPYLGSDVIDTPDYYSSCSWTMTYAGQTLEGNTNETWSAGVTLLFAAGVNGVQINPSCVGCRLSQWQEFGGGKPMETGCYNGNPVTTPFVGVGDGILVYGGEPVLDRVQANCNARNGVHLDGSNVVISGFAGQPDDWSMIRVYTTSNMGNNIYIHGGDSSAGYADGLIMYFSAQAGLADNSPFGNSFVSTFTTANGRDPGVSQGVASNITSLSCTTSTCSVVAASAVAGIQNHIWILIAGTANHNGTFWINSFTDSQHFSYAITGANTGTETVGTVRTDSSGDVYAQATRTVFDGACTAGDPNAFFTSQSAQFGSYAQTGATISIAGANSGSTYTTTITAVRAEYSVQLAAACPSTVSNAQATFSGGIDHGPMVNTDPSSIYTFNYWESDQPSAIVAEQEVFIGGSTPFAAPSGQTKPLSISWLGSNGPAFWEHHDTNDQSGGIEAQCGNTMNVACGFYIYNYNLSAQFGFYTPNDTELFISDPNGVVFDAVVGGTTDMTAQTNITLNAGSTANFIRTNTSIFANFTNTSALTVNTSGSRYEDIANCGANCLGFGGSGAQTGLPPTWAFQIADSGGSLPANYLVVSNAAAAASPALTAAGSDTNVSLTLATKGSGSVLGPNIPIVASLTTTSATSDNVTLTGMTSSGHCSLTATNASAATNLSTTYVSAKTTNQITVTHTATSGMTYDVSCTLN